MGHDGLKVAVQIRKVVIISTRICYRSVRNHPFLVGVLLFLLFLYRSSPFLFSLLVSASPVLVCTAVLLGTLLSFGEPNIPLIEEEDERVASKIAQLKLGCVESATVVEKDESVDSVSRYTELRKEIVERTFDEEPLLESTDRDSKFVTDDDVPHSSMLTDQTLREISFEQQLVDEAVNVLENFEIEQKVGFDDQKTSVVEEVEVGSSHDEALEKMYGKVQTENFEDYKSAEGSVDAQRDELETSSESYRHLDQVFEERSCPVQKIQAAIHARIRNQLESSLRSWKQLDEVVGDKSASTQKMQAENSDDYKSAEGSVDAQVRDQLESSLGSWKHLDSDHDGDDESDSESDGAESSSPDASMTDIAPMLDELHPLLEDEDQLTGNLSRQTSAATMARSEKSRESSVHSDDESDEKEEEEEAGDTKSDADDDDEEETDGSKEGPAKSGITWTEDDQKNLMDLGTSELERNQRLESLIARRRARKSFRLMSDRNMIDLDGMDLQFQVPPISTTRHNPFDFPHDSYDDLGLPPIPGSAPSVLAPRRNPFDLPYDSSEEKPDLTGDSFQQEFRELTQRSPSNQREAIFRRNETFTAGASFLDFGRQEGRDGSRFSRFRPYFVPERTDSDVMSYSSLQRQLSELSESKASSAFEAESTSADGDDEEKKQIIDHESAQEMEPSSEFDLVSLHVEHGSQCSEDVHSVSDKENEKTDFVFHVPEIELGGAANSPTAVSHTSETGPSEVINPDEKESCPETESCLSDQEFNASDIHLMTESVEDKESSSSTSSSLPKELNDMKVEDVDGGLIDMDQTVVNNVQNADVSVKYSPEKSVSSLPSENSLEASDFSHTTELHDNQPKEPIYDLSPQANKKNHSEIDLYHLSSVSRDLFVSEESKVHTGDAAETSVGRIRDTDDNGLMVKQTAEGDGKIGSELLPEINQPPIKSEASVSESEVHLSMNSSDVRLVKNELSDEKVSPHGEVQEVKLDAAESEDNMPSSIEYKAPEDQILSSEETETSMLEDFVSRTQSNLSYVEDESREEAEMEKGADDQFLPSSSKFFNQDENLFSALDESHFLPHDSVIHDPFYNVEEQEPTVTHRNLEEVVKVDDTDEAQENSLLDPLRNVERSFQPEEFEQKPVAEFANEEHANHVSQRLEDSESDENVQYDQASDTKDMDEELLSELDAVGDFSVKDMGQDLSMSVIHSDSAIDSDVAGFPELSLDSDRRDVGTDLLVPKADFLEDREASLDEVSEGEAEECSISEHVQAEVTRERVKEVPHSETGLFQEVKEVGINTTEAAVQGHTASDNTESVSEESASDLASGMSLLDKEASDRSGEDVEKVAETDKFVDIEPLPTVAEAGGSAETTLSQTDRNIEELPELLVEASIAPAVESIAQEDKLDVVESEPLPIAEDIMDPNYSPVVEASTTQAIESEVQTDTTDYVESDQLLVNRNIKVIQESPFVEASSGPSVDSEDQIERTGHVESETLLVDGDDKDVEESPVVEASSVVAVDSEDQTEIVDLLDSESLLVDDRNVKKTQELPAIEEKIASALESDDETKGVSLVESESSLIEGDIKETHESPVVDASIAQLVDDKDQTQRTDNVDSDTLLIDRDNKDTQEPPVVEACIGTPVKSETETERVAPLEPGLPLIEGDTDQMQDSPVFGSSIAAALGPEDQANTVGSLESESLLVGDRDARETQELPPESEVQTKGVSLVISDSSVIERDAKEIQESLVVEASVAPVVESERHPCVETSVAPVVESEHQIKRTDDFLSGPLLNDQDNKEMQKPPIFEEQTERAHSVESDSSHIEADPQMLLESPVAASSVLAAVKSEDQMAIVASLESESSLTDRDIRDTQDLPGVEASNARAVESKEQTEGDGDVESPAVEATIASAVEFRNQTEVSPQAEVVEVQPLHDHQPSLLPSADESTT